MRIFYITLCISYVIALIARIIGDKHSKRASFFFTIITMIILIVIAGLRSNIGDTGDYVHLYNILGEYNIGSDYEPGFLLYFKTLKLISKDPQFMIFTSALITNYLNIYIIYKYSKRNLFELSIFMYITTGYYLVTMNGIRQCLAAAIIFSCTNLMIKGKAKLYMLIVLLCSTIHATCLIMIPIYFIARTESWSKKIYIVIGITIVGLLFYNPIMSIASQVLGGKVTEYANSTEGGANIIRAIIYLVPVMLSYLKREKLKELWPDSNIFINITLISFLIMCFSTFNWVLARFTLFLECYTFILLPYIIKNCLNRKERRIVYYFCILCFFIFFTIDYPATLNGSQYRSKYRIINYFTNNITKKIIT